MASANTLNWPVKRWVWQIEDLNLQGLYEVANMTQNRKKWSNAINSATEA